MESQSSVRDLRVQVIKCYSKREAPNIAKFEAPKATVEMLLVHELLGNPTLKRRQMLAHDQRQRMTRSHTLWL
jgi:hypothetical protein